MGAYSKYPIAYFVAGSAMPDLVDRPLYWLGVTEHAHSVGHSAFLAVPLSIVLIYVLGPRGIAFAVGWVVHLLTDAFNILTTQGLAAAPHLLTYPLNRPELNPQFTTYTIELPLVEITHTAHPLVFAIEGVILLWAALVIGRDSRNRWSATESS